MPEAAREGDQSTHGGLIASGEPTVIIHGQKAARVGDDHKCPAADGSKPHDGGPILRGSGTVIIKGAAAARVGDPAACKGTPDSIAKGEPTVIIGD